ncbi:DNA (cytosine-5)-methyltransferase 1 [Epilithonimonas hungarica]|uniref:DNA cytosine methyltransferase n=1 Tax=Epilithonimonas hungarica TaxID=454006 RepID=UPI00278B7365|nr:DNA cytosine methyltransferase [Epilithonimonas hungarica]MDP9954726.1 DNA (cytosine-5)-methyltransferase 1 [Epilithonimonas hungarica]
MKTYKVLNLYACLGGNRYKWDESAKEAGVILEVTAVELDPELARLYKERFPNDIVIVADAHQYLLDHYKEFDFIWSSPPCPSHSKARFWGSKGGQCDVVYPDMMLYQEIILLSKFFKGRYVVENVNPYYEPLIEAQKRGRHLYWTNFQLPDILSKRFDVATERKKNELNNLCDFHDYDFRLYKGDQPIVKIARNLVDYEAGKTILDTALGIYNQPKRVIQSLFDESTIEI